MTHPPWQGVEADTGYQVLLVEGQVNKGPGLVCHGLDIGLFFLDGQGKTFFSKGEIVCFSPYLFQIGQKFLTILGPGPSYGQVLQVILLNKPGQKGSCP